MALLYLRFPGWTEMKNRKKQKIKFPPSLFQETCRISLFLSRFSFLFLPPRIPRRMQEGIKKGQGGGRGKPFSGEEKIKE